MEEKYLEEIVQLIQQKKSQPQIFLNSEINQRIMDRMLEVKEDVYAIIDNILIAS